MLWLYMLLALSFITNTVKEGILKAFKNESPPKYEEVWVKLYKGNPGEAGAAEAAGETKRIKVPLTGTTVLKNNAALVWTGVSTAETPKFLGFWTTEGGGTFLGYTELAAEYQKAVSIGDNIEIPKEGFEWKVA